MTTAILILGAAFCALIVWANLAGQRHPACQPVQSVAPTAPAELVRHAAPELVQHAAPTGEVAK